MQVDALRAIGQEGARPAGGALFVGGDDHQKRGLGHRHKGLRSQRVPLDQIKGVGQRPGNGIEDRKPRAAIGNVDPGAVMETGAETRIDHPVGCAGGFQDIAEGGEGMGGQRFSGNLHHDGCTAWVDGAGVFHPPSPANGPGVLR